MAVRMDVTADGKALKPSPAIALFPTRISSTGQQGEYVVRNGRFLMNTFVEQNAAPITLVLNAVTPKD
jgi:hypothetical protein